MKIAIIGAGASGIVASIVAKKLNPNMLIDIFDSNSSIGKKILASGNGRCNISNTNLSTHNYMGKNLSFLEFALKEFNFSKLEEFLKNEIGLLLDIKENNKVYPLSNEAKSVVNLFNSKLDFLKINKILETTIKDIKKQNEKFTLYTEDKIFKNYDKILISCGLGAYPQLKASEDGLLFAKKFGHKIENTYPSLVGLNIKGDFCKRVEGIKKEARVSLYVNDKKYSEIFGDILFTNYGVSGFAILDISQVASLKLLKKEKVTLKVDLFSNIQTDDLTNMIKESLKANKDEFVLVALQGLLSSKLIKEVIHLCNLPKEIKANELNINEIKTITNNLKNLNLEVTQTQGFKHSEVSGGGVCVDEIYEKTYMSKLCKNLYFSGEVLDITGQRGGYNLHFAFASGCLAGKDLSSST